MKSDLTGRRVEPKPAMKATADSAPLAMRLRSILWVLAFTPTGCIDLALPPLGDSSANCPAATREMFLQTVPGSVRRDLWIAFVDVGHGDATWLRLPGTVGVDAGEVLIDAGDDGLPVAPHVPDGGGAVLSLMARGGLVEGDRLDALLLTHPDKDHYGGAAAVLRRHPADVVLFGGCEPSGPVWARLRALAEGLGIGWRSAPAVRGAPVSLAAFAIPEGDVRIGLIYADPTADADNDTSLIVEVRFAGQRILLMGDAGAEIEPHVAARIEPVAILRTGHHGGQHTSSAEFLDQVLETRAHGIISAGGRSGLPHPAVLERLHQRMPGRVWRTDRNDETLTRRAAAGDDHILVRISADDGRVEICFLDPDPLGHEAAADP